MKSNQLLTVFTRRHKLIRPFVIKKLRLQFYP